MFDSALRSGVRLNDVLDHAQWLGVRQYTKVARVAHQATRKAANPFESCLRAIALGAAGLRVQAQVELTDVGFYARVDLADEALGLVLEADSHEFHTARGDFNRDCRRYNGLVSRDLLVLRFTWEDVMLHPEQVHAVIERTVALRLHRLSRDEARARLGRRGITTVLGHVAGAPAPERRKPA